MRVQRAAALTLLAGSMAVGVAAGLHEVAVASQRPAVLLRFLAGYFDRKGRFVPTAGRGATNVERNAILLFVFSGAIDMGTKQKATLPLTLAERADHEQGEPGVLERKPAPDIESRYVCTGSVNSRSAVIATPTAGGGETTANGVFFRVPAPRGNQLFGNRFTFNPRFLAATFGNPREIDYNPDGFEPNTRYNVTLDGGPDPADPFNLVRNRSGVQLSAPFSTFFETTDGYVQDFTRPEIRTTSPVELSTNVPSDADVEISFSEPMDVTSFQLPRFQTDDSWTMRVNYSDSPSNGPLAGRNVLGVVRVKPQTAGNVIQFRPSQGFGKGPYEVVVTVTAGVTDLSGNNITRQQQIIFTTEDDPDAPTGATIEEVFADNAQEDPSITPTGDNDRAVWSTAGGDGLLKSVINTKNFDAQSAAGAVSNANLWLNLPIHLHLLFPVGDMGNRPRTLTGFNWYRTTAIGQTYPSTIVQMGHANDIVSSSGFSTGSPPGPAATNFRETPRVLHTSAPYTTPPASSGNVVPGPVWGQNFNSNGQHAVILDISHGGHGGAASSDERWSMDNLYSIGVISYIVTTTPASTNQTRNWYFRTNFTYLSPGAEARSLWYNTSIPNARYLPQVVIPSVQPAGTQVSFQWQGAKADANNPAVLDINSITAWVDDVRLLTNNQFVRFHVVLSNNLNTKEAPTIDTLILPFTFQ